MRKALLATASMLALLLAACGGGGGGSPAAPPPPGAPPPPPPPPPGPTDPATALTRPISSLALCANGLAKRQAALSADQFVDVGASVGINHSHFVEDAVWTLQSGSLESVMRTGAVLATETNGDCWPDLIFSNGATTSGQLVAYSNLEGRGFSQTLLNIMPSSSPIAGMGTADLNGDYRLDLALGNLLAGSTETVRARAAGGFERLQAIAMSRSTFGFAVGDYSGDQWPDLYAAHWDIAPPAADSPAMLRNLGSSSALPDGSLIGADAAAGTTAAAVGHDFNLSPGFVDLDGDRNPDLLIASDFATSEVLQHTGAAAYSVLSASVPLSDENAAGHAIRDFDNDGQWDWFVASVHGPADSRPWPWGLAGNKLYFGDAQSPYLTAAGTGTGVEDAEWPWGVCAQDFNNDGLTDLFVENGFGFAPAAVMASQSTHPFVQQINDSLYDKQFLRARLFINQGNRSFAEASQAWGITGSTNGRGVACLDYDRDGDIDIAVAQNSGPAILYENQHSASAGNNFLGLRLMSIAPNTHALGAVVTVAAGGQTQMQQVSANSNFLGQDAYDLHFGLATATTVNAVTVDWPSGTASTYSDLPASRFVTLLDPRMLPFADAARLARIDAAIAAAEAYVAVPAQLDEDILLGLSWMQRMHGLSLTYAPGDELIARALQYESQGQSSAASQLRVWRRIFDPVYQVSNADFNQLVGFDAVTFPPVYCHQFPLVDANIQDMRDYVLLGGYYTTHVLLALLWAIDNACPMPPAYDQNLLSDTIRDVYAIADAGGSSVLDDLRVDAMAILAAAGRHDLIQASWVDQILDEQLAGGGWKGDPNDSEPADHTTGLALWLLLQLAEEGKVFGGFVAQEWD